MVQAFLIVLIAFSGASADMVLDSGAEQIALTPEADRVAAMLDQGWDVESVRGNLESAGWKIDQTVVEGSWLVLEKIDRMASTAAVAATDHIARVSPYFVWKDGVEFFPTKEIIIRYRSGLHRDDKDRMLSRLGLVETVRYRDVDRVMVETVEPLAFGGELELAATLSRESAVEWAQPNFVRLGMQFGRMAPNDFYYNDQWHLPQIAAPAGWDIQTGSTDIVIAVIDDGVDSMHEDLGMELVTGWDAVLGTYDADPNCNDGHGTACAGLAAAGTDNGFGVAGVGFDCRIMPVRIFSNGSTQDAWIIDALDYAEFLGADVFSCSWGGGPPTSGVTAEINQATQYGRNGKGIVAVFAAGNSGGAVAYPANLPNVIAVGAVNQWDQLWYYSCTGSEIDVVAPSGDVNLNGDVVTTDVSWECGYDDDASPSYTERFGGTSAACPMVAGLAGLVLSQDPQLTYQQASAAIYAGCDDLGASTWYGHGRINCGATLAAMLPDPEVTVTSPNTAVTWTIGHQETITWSSCNDCGITGHTVALKRGSSAWQNLGTVGAATQSFNWTVTGPASSSCLIRVTSSVDGGGSVYDQSNVAFVIQDEPAAIIDVTSAAFGMTLSYHNGAAWGDYNHDGDLDLYMTHGSDTHSNSLWANNGAGVFTDVTTTALEGSGRYRGATWLDIDGDGHLELHAACSTGEDLLLSWTGTQFTTYTSGLANSTEPRSLSNWHDHDADGDPDLLVAYRDVANVLNIHQNNGVFTTEASPVPELAGRELEVVWCDFDNDGDQDLHVFNYDSGNQFFVNQGDGTYVDMHATYFAGVGMYRSLNWGDYDNDGYLDIATYADDCLILLRNVQGQSFQLIPYSTHHVCIGGWAADYKWLDFDNDGYLDLVCPVDADGASEMFFGNGDGTFGSEIYVPGHNETGFFPADFDSDGDLDLFATSGSGVYMLKNHLYAAGHHWLQMDFVDQAGRVAPLGTRVVVHDSHGQQMRVLGVSDCAASGVMTFGLGSTATISQVLVYWPDGTVQDVTADVVVDTRQTITQPAHDVVAEIIKAGQSYFVDQAVLFGCPDGDADELVLTIDFDDSEVSGTILAADVSILMDDASFGICGAPYADIDGTAGNGYTVTLRRKYLHGCSGCVGGGCDPDNVGTSSLSIEYNGEIVGVASGLTVRTTDLTGDGIVNLADITVLAQAINKPFGDPAYNACVDFNGDDAVNLTDLSMWAGHNGHGCSTAKVSAPSAPLSEVVRSEPIDGHDQQRLYLRVNGDAQTVCLELPLSGSNAVKSWRATDHGADALYVTSERDGQTFLSVFVSNLDDLAGRELGLVDVTLNEASADGPVAALAGATASVLRHDGSVVMFSGGDDVVPADLEISGVHRVFPNPFNPQVTIEYAVARSTHVQIQVYDVAGRLVRTLVDEGQEPTGLRSVVWDGRNNHGQPSATGVYVWRMKTGESVETGRVVMLK